MSGALFVLLVFLLNTALLIYFALRNSSIKVKGITIEVYTIIILVGPLILLLTRYLSPAQVFDGIKKTGSSNPGGILVLFLSMVFISVFLDSVGFMEYCAKLALKAAGQSGRKLFFSLYFMVSFLTIFTSNDIIILTITPFIYYFAKNASLDPKPYLLAEFFAANTWSMMLQIGNPTNIFITTAFDITFFDYLKWMLLPTIAGGLVNMFLIYYIFRKSIDKKITTPENINPSESIKDELGATLGVLILSICTISLAVAPYLGFEMWKVSLFFAILLLIILAMRDLHDFSRKEKTFFPTIETLKRMPWGIVPFVLSFFVLVHAIEIYGVTGLVRQMLSFSETSVFSSIFVYGSLSSIASNILNNIPMSVAFTSIMNGLSGTVLFASALATTVGSNLGANITPIGALAGIMWISILKNKDYKITYSEFIKYGVIITLFVLITTLSVLAIEFFVFGLS